ncbi:DEAD/DEAH box helicase [Bdellovibrio bacteriovorus]|uniref:DEAD/DEAH box helicase n=1 Tax=Bdellovibrio bacteriovorus TaxID=959 RepID=UPI0021CEE1FE|nr:DEAD/DEAH box helicase [Bdellovibrio bacteriovorus]UXR64212.1 DEAD/DEAH box helicase [Bdellovibrio bacteriovorus]
MKVVKFSELNLDSLLVSAIQKIGYDDCTPIQEQAMPPVLDGKDVAGLAQTGTGKTAAFLIPLMERILRARPAQGEITEEQKAAIEKRAFADWKPQNFILILVPTRELAEQVQDNINKLSTESGLRGFAIYGGTGYDKQKEALKNGVEFIVATPGRLIDLYKEHLVDLKQVRAIVFDEADRMFDMGFKDDMKYILQRVPRERQLLVFSATLNFDVLNTVYQFGSEPVEINISRDQAKAENVKDQIFHVGNEEKPQHLLSLLKVHNPKQAIIFTNFKMSVERIAKFLTENGIPAMAISSLLTQAQRNRVIEQFKAENDMNILVATDVAARGLDIKGVDMVVNFELPMDSESYVHRIGRTGRAGTTGQAFSLVGDKDIESLARIEDYLKHKVEVGYLENDQLVKDFKPMSSHFEGHYPKSLDRARAPREGGRGGEKRGDRGPRRERGDRGPRQERGPRPEGQQKSAQGAQQGQGPQGRQDNRPKRQHEGGPKRHDGKRGDQKPRHDQQARKPHGQQQQRQGASARKRVPVAAQKSIGQKVAGFFKRLFS